MIFDIEESDDDYSSVSEDEFDSDSDGGYSSDNDSSGTEYSLYGDSVTEVREDVRWDVGQVIRVRFINGHPSLHRKVKTYARLWTKYANIHFQFVSKDPSDVRISFYKGDGCHSKIGRHALKVPAPKETMNLSLSRRTPEDDIRRHVLHEFGHVLGCSHEHSSPRAHIPWNKRAAYSYFMKEYEWDADHVWSNILKVKPSNSIASAFDPKSIMIYKIPFKVTNGRFRSELNTKLSEIDKQFIAEQYPRPLKCNRCRVMIRKSHDIYFYCRKHNNNLCENCYDSDNTRSQVRGKDCSYKVINDEDGEYVKCNRCRAGTRLASGDLFYCGHHKNYLCDLCYDTSTTRRQVRKKDCSYKALNDEEGKFIKCNRCRAGTRAESGDFYYCNIHNNFLCEVCYDTNTTRRMIKRKECDYEDGYGYVDEYDDYGYDY